jgi:recombinational DNA repair protein (RecF pathway)
MSYGVYTTEALVCGNYHSNTADKSFLLFTKEAGMVYASARSVREERSRQRYALQDFSLITVSLIKGKTGWRIGSVDGKENLFSLADNRERRGSLVRFMKLIRRYIQGEEPHRELYIESIEALRFLTRGDLPQRTLAEEILTARFLSSLGYMSDNPVFAPVYTGSIADALVATPESLLPALQKATAEALRASHL